MRKVLLIGVFLFWLYPQNKAFAQMDVPIVSEAAVLVDTQSNAVLFAKNEQEPMNPASLTKIATAIYAIEKGQLSDEVIVPHDALEVDGTKVYLNEGEKVTLEKLIEGMLINSGNDAAYAIAIHLDGTMEQFQTNFNKFLREVIGVQHTQFMNPHGLYDVNHYTTALDLAMITNYAMKNNVFQEIFGTKELVWDGLTWDTTLYTHHLLLKGEIPFAGVTGGKTGFVNESGQTLATTASNGQINLTAICLKSSFKRDIYNDTINLFTQGFANYKTTLLPMNKSFSNQQDKYVLQKPLYITEPIAGAHLEVTGEGELVVKGSNGEEVQSITIKDSRVEEKKPPVMKQAERETGTEPWMNHSVLIAGFVSFLAMAIGVRNKMR